MKMHAIPAWYNGEHVAYTGEYEDLHGERFYICRNGYLPQGLFAAMVICRNGSGREYAVAQSHLAHIRRTCCGNLGR